MTLLMPGTPLVQARFTVMSGVRLVMLIALGTWLLITGLQFAGLNDVSISSTKSANALLGATVGAGVGWGAFLVVGGIGVVTGGVGFALGAMAFTAFGIGAGALTGAATGRTTVVIFSYPTWLWVLLLTLGCTSLYLAYGRLRRWLTVEQFQVLGRMAKLPPVVQVCLSRAFILVFLTIGIFVGGYASTVTQRRPPPPPTLENVVFIDNGILMRAKQHIGWNGKEKIILNTWSGYQLRVGDMTFIEAAGLWRERE